MNKSLKVQPFKYGFERAISSEVEHYLDTVGVTGSIPVSPIKNVTDSKSNSLIIVLGLGRSGLAAAKYLNEKGNNVLVFEKSRKESFEELAKNLQTEGIQVQLGMPLKLSSFEPWENQFSMVITSPGIPWDHPTLNQLRKKGILIEPEISLAWKTLQNIPWIGITGTNGKTTVTHMLNHVLNENLISSDIAGNVGKAASELALKLHKSHQITPKWLVVELSSFQIESAPEIKPYIGIWTTLTPDHLERHGSLKNYIQIKRSLIEKSFIRIYNGDDKFLAANRLKLPKGIWITTEPSTSNKSHYDYWISVKGKLMEGEEELFESSVLNLPGEHNLQNLLLVTAAARKIGLSSKGISNAINNFQGLPHRLESINEIKNINILNDSKATNLDSSEIALKAIKGKTILIAGGRLKEGNTNGWLKQINLKASAVILFGESGMTLKNLIKESGFKGYLNYYQDLDQSLKRSIELVKKLKAKIILFSPGCASYDQYNNFEERGNHFKSLIRKYSIYEPL